MSPLSNRINAIGEREMDSSLKIVLRDLGYEPTLEDEASNKQLTIFGDHTLCADK